MTSKGFSMGGVWSGAVVVVVVVQYARFAPKYLFFLNKRTYTCVCVLIINYVRVFLAIYICTKNNPTFETNKIIRV